MIRRCYLSERRAITRHQNRSFARARVDDHLVARLDPRNRARQSQEGRDPGRIAVPGRLHIEVIAAGPFPRGRDKSLHPCQSDDRPLAEC